MSIVEQIELNWNYSIRIFYSNGFGLEGMNERLVDPTVVRKSIEQSHKTASKVGKPILPRLPQDAAPAIRLNRKTIMRLGRY